MRTSRWPAEVPPAGHRRPRSAPGHRLLALEPAQELVAARRPLGVLLHHLLEELRDVVVPAVAGVADVLPVVVAGLQRVVLHRDQVEDHVAETGLPGCHRTPPPSITARCGPRRIPQRSRRNPVGSTTQRNRWAKAGIWL